MISWGLKTQNIRPIGLDIDRNCIRMIQLAVSEGSASVLAAQSVRVDADVNDNAEQRKAFVVSAIKQMLIEGKFRGRDVVSCLPSDKLNITSFRLGESKNDEIEQALKKEAIQRFGLDPDKDTIEYLVAGSVRQGDEIKDELILFGTEQEAIVSHIKMLEQAGLKPVAIDMIPCALFRSFRRLLRRQEDKKETIVFLNVGKCFTTVVFGRGGEICFVKQIPIGGEMLDCQIAEKLGIGIDEAETLRQRLQIEKAAKMKAKVSVPEQDTMLQGGLDTSTRQVMVDAIGSVAEELAKEISLCFIYYSVTFRGKRVGRAFLAGTEAYESILRNVLKRQLTVEIEVAQPLRGFDIKGVNFDNAGSGMLCEWTVPTGLALKGLDPDFFDSRSDGYERN